jgi:hypothetical protein
MGYRKAAVDGPRNGHDFKDVGELLKGDTAHGLSFKMYRLMKPGASDGLGHLLLKSLRISCALLLTKRHEG